MRKPENDHGYDFVVGNIKQPHRGHTKKTSINYITFFALVTVIVLFMARGGSNSDDPNPKDDVAANRQQSTHQTVEKVMPTEETSVLTTPLTTKTPPRPTPVPTVNPLFAHQVDFEAGTIISLLESEIELWSIKPSFQGSKDRVNIQFNWTNFSEDIISPSESFRLTAYQDGVELKAVFLSEGSATSDYRGIMPGVTMSDLRCVFELRDDETPVLVVFTDKNARNPELYRSVFIETRNLLNGTNEAYQNNHDISPTPRPSFHVNAEVPVLPIGDTFETDHGELVFTGIHRASHDEKQTLILTYEWTNTSLEPATPGHIIDLSTYQDGIELPYLNPLALGARTSAVEVDPGETLETLALARTLRNTSSDILAFLTIGGKEAIYRISGGDLQSASIWAPHSDEPEFPSPTPASITKEGTMTFASGNTFKINDGIFELWALQELVRSGDEYVVMTYNLTNLSRSEINPYFTYDVKAYQNGVELDTDYSALSHRDSNLRLAAIRAGATSYGIKVPFKLKSNDPVTFIFSEKNYFTGMQDEMLVTIDLDVLASEPHAFAAPEEEPVVDEHSRRISPDAQPYLKGTTFTMNGAQTTLGTIRVVETYAGKGIVASFDYTNVSREAAKHSRLVNISAYQNNVNLYEIYSERYGVMYRSTEVLAGYEAENMGIVFILNDDVTEVELVFSSADYWDDTSYAFRVVVAE